MEAMQYEYLVRRVYQVGRYGHEYANADIYRKLEYAERAYRLDLENIKQKQMRVSTSSIKDLEYDYNSQCHKIWHYITEVIRDGISKYGSKFSADETNAMNAAIDPPLDITKEHIDKVIKAVQDIYVKHEIFPK